MGNMPTLFLNLGKLVTATGTIIATKTIATIHAPLWIREPHPGQQDFRIVSASSMAAASSCSCLDGVLGNACSSGMDGSRVRADAVPQHPSKVRPQNLLLLKNLGQVRRSTGVKVKETQTAR